MEERIVSFYDPFASEDTAGDCAAVLQWLQHSIAQYPDRAVAQHPRATDFTAYPGQAQSKTAAMDPGRPIAQGWRMNLQAMPAALQTDGYNCGVHIIQIAAAIVDGRPIPTQATLGASRQERAQTMTNVRWRLIHEMYHGARYRDERPQLSAAGVADRQLATAARVSLWVADVTVYVPASSTHPLCGYRLRMGRSGVADPGHDRANGRRARQGRAADPAPKRDQSGRPDRQRPPKRQRPTKPHGQRQRHQAHRPVETHDRALEVIRPIKILTTLVNRALHGGG